MTTDEFKLDEWTKSLSQALAALADTHNLHQDGSSCSPDSLFDDLSSLYFGAFSEQDYGSEEHQKSICSALINVRTVLAQHPVWATLVNRSDGGGSFFVQEVAGGGRRELLGIIVGLMARALQLSEDGFQIAVSELNKLIAPREDSRCRGEDLFTGYHAVVLYGLRIDEEFPILDDMIFVPFKHASAFVNENFLNDVMHDTIDSQSLDFMTVVMKPFSWKPKFYSRYEHSRVHYNAPDWRDFPVDVMIFSELLSVFHGSPVIQLAIVPYCIHRTALWLIGRPSNPRNCSWDPMNGLLARSIQPRDMDRYFLKEAITTFCKRNCNNYKICAPVIARLAEALARRGRFKDDDKVLDTAIALEQIYQLDRNAISYTLGTRAACFLETSKEDRFRIFQDIKKFYSTRSKIIHGNETLSKERKSKDFHKGFKIARDSIAKLLRDGRPSDWNEIVIGGT